MSQEQINIDEYIRTSMEGTIERRGKSPLAWIVLTLIGAAILGITIMGKMNDTLQMLLLTIGVGSLAVGIIMVVLCCSKTLWNYYYLPTRSTMKRGIHYLSLDEYNRCVELLTNGKYEELNGLTFVNSSNAALKTVVSKDMSFMLLQVGRLDSSEFECGSPVARIEGETVSKLYTLIK